VPYINQDRRKVLDSSIDQLCLSIKSLLTTDNVFNKTQITNEEFLSICGDINYCFSRIVSNLMKDVSYSKIVMITGILENVKEEFYRRIAVDYENEKILENEDIIGYKKNV
jgi:hypothetical protein